MVDVHPSHRDTPFGNTKTIFYQLTSFNIQLESLDCVGTANRERQDHAPRARAYDAAAHVDGFEFVHDALILAKGIDVEDGSPLS
jgi:hypothetical protein